MNRKRVSARSCLSIAASIALAGLALTAIPAYGGQVATNPIPGAIASGQMVQAPSANPNVTVYVAAPGAAVKAELAPEIQAYLASQTLPTSSPASGIATAVLKPAVGVDAGNNYLGRYGVGNLSPPGCGSAEIESGFSSDAYSTHSGFTAYVSFSGNSYLYWFGSCPVDWTQGALVNEWWANGISVSFDLPLGVGFSGSSNTESQNQSENNNWEVLETFSNVNFSGTDISSADESAGYDVTLSGHAYYNPDQDQD